jgi:hypothetical protein
VCDDLVRYLFHAVYSMSASNYVFPVHTPRCIVPKLGTKIMVQICATCGNSEYG